MCVPRIRSVMISHLRCLVVFLGLFNQQKRMAMILTGSKSVRRIC